MSLNTSGCSFKILWSNIISIFKPSFTALASAPILVFPISALYPFFCIFSKNVFSFILLG
uniref:Uncharacterized protein n=1 Tax=Methanococcus maripaludis (strain C5 / ATCC BAA-1333) TaxID=402880 RepID=O06100_METM5|nr:unknown [Methanococcus maripaludis C5]